MKPRFAPVSIEREAVGDGGRFVLRARTPLGPYPRCLGDLLVHWAKAAPDRAFLVERDEAGVARTTTYGEALASVRAIAHGLHGLGGSAQRPVMLLSDNAIDHALMQLAAMHVGVPAAPVSPAYSLLSRDHGKLRELAARLNPSIIYASDGALHARGLAALADRDAAIVVSANPPPSGRVVRFDELQKEAPGESVDRAFAAVSPDTIAKVLFTSGSTGAPKGVVNTQRMLCSNQQAIAQCWPFLEERPPIVVDWLPWSHTFGGNHNFDMVLRNGGTMHIDAGKPAPGRIEITVRNLRAVSPTLYFNVPRGFDMLLPFLEKDDALRTHFFHDLDLIFYAAAALPQSTWRRLEAVSMRAHGSLVSMVSAWGSTETAPLVTSVHFPIDRAGVIGVPAPGCELAFVPSGDKLEMRVRGPNVTPGYYGPSGMIEPVVLDDDGFLPTGDAGRLEDPDDPSAGVVFDGRTAENFKLSSGTWVAVGAVRIALISACAPLVQDAVIAGHDRDSLGALVFPSPTPLRALVGAPEDEPLEALVHRPEVQRAIVEGVRAHNRQHDHGSTRIERVIVLIEPPSIDDGEITDKGYLNQRAALERRRSFVERLFSAEADAEVLRCEA